ncbi:hypothetical protein [Defluviitalea raffinosedens]|uniref:hypothetical protein n=1 Tax=Defluviitalea raffinosedens TaxID=1450156 RepID=UPI001957B47C|nr:hypothetical protein [Defluviitalea raffinosedens]MBM7684516.1 hypothetical protein [Defluviitalea raffinosedens]
MDQRAEKMELIQTLVEYTGRLIKGINEAVDSFHEGMEGKGMDLVVQIIDGLKWTMEAITLTLDAQVEPVDVSEIIDPLNAMIEALENIDYVLIGDVLEYEILPKVEEWNQKLNLTIGE